MTFRERIEDAFLAVIEGSESKHLPREFTIHVPSMWTEGRKVQPIRVDGYTIHVEPEGARR